MNFLPAPRVSLFSVWHLCWLLSFPGFTHAHLPSLRSSTVGELCNFKSRILPLSMPAPCNNPQFVFHKWNSKESFPPSSMYFKPYIPYLVLKYAQHFNSNKCFFESTNSGQLLWDFVWPSYLFYQDHAVRSAWAAIQGSAFFKTNKRPTRTKFKELLGQLSLKSQEIIRFYRTLCN